MTELSSRSCEELFGCVCSDIWEVGGYIWISDDTQNAERCCITGVKALSRLFECLRLTKDAEAFYLSTNVNLKMLAASRQFWVK